MNTYSVFYYGNEYICREFTNVDPDVSGIEIKDALSDKIVGTMVGYHIPDIDDLDGDASDTIKFDEKVKEFIDNNL